MVSRHVLGVEDDRDGAARVQARGARNGEGPAASGEGAGEARACDHRSRGAVSAGDQVRIGDGRRDDDVRGARSESGTAKPAAAEGVDEVGRRLHPWFAHGGRKGVHVDDLLGEADVSDRVHALDPQRDRPVDAGNDAGEVRLERPCGARRRQRGRQCPVEQDARGGHARTVAVVDGGVDVDDAAEREGRGERRERHDGRSAVDAKARDGADLLPVAGEVGDRELEGNDRRHAGRHHSGAKDVERSGGAGERAGKAGAVRQHDGGGRHSAAVVGDGGGERDVALARVPGRPVEGTRDGRPVLVDGDGHRCGGKLRLAGAVQTARTEAGPPNALLSSAESAE